MEAAPPLPALILRTCHFNSISFADWVLLRRDRAVLLLRKFLALLAELTVLRLRVLNVVLVLRISRAVAAEMPNAINASAFSVFHGPAPRLELGPPLRKT